MMLRQLQYFHAVVRTGSFTEAAEECFISQSAISQQIKALENDLGVKLLIRRNRSFHQQEAEQDYYQNALGLGNAYIFAENNEEASLLVAGNRGVMIEEEFQGNYHNMDFAKKIPLMRYGTQMTKPYCLFWKVENDNEKIQRFAGILKKYFFK